METKSSRQTRLIYNRHCFENNFQNNFQNSLPVYSNTQAKNASLVRSIITKTWRLTHMPVFASRSINCRQKFLVGGIFSLVNIIKTNSRASSVVLKNRMTRKMESFQKAATVLILGLSLARSLPISGMHKDYISD